MLTRSSIPTLLATLLLAATPAIATPIMDQATGLASPGTIIDFGDNLFADGTVIDDEFAALGVSFGPTWIYDDNDNMLPAVEQGRIVNADTTSTPGAILFAAPVSEVAFSLLSNRTTATISAYLGGVEVESFVVAVGPEDAVSGHYSGFEGILLDEVRIEIGISNQSSGIDNLQFTVVPEPGGAILLGLGLLGLGCRRRR